MKENIVKFSNLNKLILEPISYYMKNFDTAFEMGMHQHQYFEIMYVHSGSLTLEVFNENETPQLSRYAIHTGQFIVIDSYTLHRIVIDISETSFIYNIEFEPRVPENYNPYSVNQLVKIDYGELFLKTNLKSISSNKGGFIIVNDTKQVDNALKRLILILQEGVYSIEQACLVAISQMNLFIEVSECLTAKAIGNFSYIRKTNVFIQENFQLNITIDQIAEYVGINSSYLQRQYKKQTGQTIHKSINILRIQKAANLLVSTIMSIQDIANQVGLKTKNQLNYEFKKIINMTPSEYRQKMKKNSVDHHYENYISHAITLP